MDKQEKLTALFFRRANAVQNADEARLSGDFERYHYWLDKVNELNERIQNVKNSASANITASDARNASGYFRDDS